MEFEFANSRIRKLYSERKGADKYPSDVIEAFFEVMTIIESEPTTQEIRKRESLHFEKLEPREEGKHSVRLVKAWRLIFTIEKDNEGSYLRIVRIEEDYHKKKGAR